jgi:hypothetical protein
MVLAGLIARELGGQRQAQVIAAVTTALAPISLVASSMFVYTSFDYLCGFCALTWSSGC